MQADIKMVITEIFALKPCLGLVTFHSFYSFSNPTLPPSPYSLLFPIQNGAVIGI